MIDRVLRDRQNNVEEWTCPLSTEFPAKRTLRIGFVSADFRRHAVTHFLFPLIWGGLGASAQLFFYDNACRAEDEATAELKKWAYTWRAISGVETDSVVKQIRADQVDVIVDLSGHSSRNRLDIFLHRVARVHITWLGYPATTGLSTMDYRIGDSYADVGSAEFYSEKVICPSGPFICYQPPEGYPGGRSVAIKPRDASNEVVFGSFNSLKKITTSVIKVWAEIMKRCPEGVLLLKHPMLFHESVRQRVSDEFMGQGVDRDRLTLIPGVVDHNDHFEMYNRVDIALDPFPYNGTTTTCEALWMGVPVVVLAGNQHHSRVGCSLLNWLGREEWVNSSEEEYIACALSLGRDREYLQELRKGVLREELLASPLCDQKKFARSFSDLLGQILRMRRST